MLNDDVVFSQALSPEQRALASLMDGDACANKSTITAQLMIDEPVDWPRLKTIVEQRLKAHQLLAATLGCMPGWRGLRMQYRDKVCSIVWYEYDISHCVEYEVELSACLDQFCANPLAVGDGELLRVGLIRLQESRCVLVLMACSLVVDRGSILVLTAQIAAEYRDKSYTVPPNLFQYSQFIEWREALDNDADAKQGQEYWTQYLADKQGLIAPRPGYRKSLTLQSGNRCRVDRSIEGALLTAFCDLAQNASSSVATIMHGIWWLLLARIIGFEPFIGGWQHDCRQDYRVMNHAVGVFEKILPLTVDVDPDESFIQWLMRFGTVLNSHAAAQEYWSVDAPAITAHLDVGFAFYQSDDIALDSTWRFTELPGPMPCFELALQVDWTGNTAELSVYADSARYTSQAIARLLEQYMTLLTGIVENPSIQASVLPVVGLQERAALLTMNETQLDLDSKMLFDCVAIWAKSTPNAPAVVHGAVELSYSQLDLRANCMAHWLQSQGITRGDLVALNLPRSADLIITILAVWRAGAAYLPLDLDWPQQRYEIVLKEAAPILLIATKPLSTTINDANWRYADISVSRFDNFPHTPPRLVTQATDIAYVLYTSGSTGKPKGVITEHRHLSNYVAAASQAMLLQRCRCWALISPIVTDLGHTALFGALFNGACIAIADQNDVNDAQAFTRFIDNYNVDALKIVPSHLEALLEVEKPRLPHTIVLGGESPSTELIERIAMIDPQCIVYNHYGPTETTVGVLVHRLALDADSEPIPLTQVLANNTVYVLDDSRQLVPSGGLGEVYIGGMQLCRSYIGNAVTKVFVDNPFDMNERLYRSGDLAYVLPEGGIRLVGRSDQQVKIRGFRVELAEVETTLQALSGVRQAVVLASHGATGDTELYAGIVVEPGVEENSTAVSNSLATLLPAYMLPAHYHYFSEFPRLANGKVDRQTVADLALSNAPVGCGISPRNDVEFFLADCMARLLKRPAVSIDDNFFAIGGHSLLVIKLAARIRKVLRVDIAPGLVFDYPTVAELAAVLSTDDDTKKRLITLAQSYRQSHSLDEPRIEPSALTDS